MGETLCIEQIRRAVSEAAALVDIDRAYLFGSYARGEADANSDVDICIEAGPTLSLFGVGAFSSVLEKSLNRPVDVVSERSLFPRARQGMLDDRVLVYARA